MLGKHWFLLALAAGFVVGCNVVSVGSTTTDHESLPLEGIEAAEITIKMGVGDLTVRGGASNLFDADFTYNVDAWKPKIDYSTRGNTGVLSIEQPSVSSAVPDSRVEYKWDVQLDPTLKKEVNISLGVGKSTLNLGGVNLTNLDVNIGVGGTTLDLSGAWTDDADIKIKGGVGEATIILPRAIGIRVTTNTGLGDILAYDLRQNGKVYTNDAYGNSPIQLTIDVEGGVGKIELRLSDQ